MSAVAADLRTWLQLCVNTQSYDGVVGADGRKTFTVAQLAARARATLSARQPTDDDAHAAVTLLLAAGQLERHDDALCIAAAAINPLR